MITSGVADEVGLLLEQVHLLRPVREVAVPPFLLFRTPLSWAALDVLVRTQPVQAVTREEPRAQVGAVGALGVVELLEAGLFGLPSEAEWEYAARAGQPGTLTWTGDVVPDDETFREWSSLELEKGCNAFGVGAIGLFADVCADAVGNYADAPLDGGPREGGGPRVCRGGAAWLYPWQGCGEWHLLLNAYRASQPRQLALRPALGLELTS